MLSAIYTAFDLTASKTPQYSAQKLKLHCKSSKYMLIYRLSLLLSPVYRSTHIEGSGSSAIWYVNNLKTKNSALKGLIFCVNFFIPYCAITQYLQCVWWYLRENNANMEVIMRVLCLNIIKQKKCASITQYFMCVV